MKKVTCNILFTTLAFIGLSNIAIAQTMVKDIRVGATGSNPAYLHNANGTLFFTCADGVTTYSALWKSDSTAAGTTLVNSSLSYSYLQKFSSIGNTVIFNGSSGDIELYKSDGTTAGTVLVKNINPSSSSNPLGFTNFKNIVYFAANDGTNGNCLWRTDGTTGGTYYLSTATPNPGRFTEMGGMLYFGTSSGELWKTDGTSIGTTMIADLNPASSGAFFGQSLAAVGSKLFFVMSDGTTGYELWVTDGTSAGTKMVKEIKAGAGDGIDYSNGQLTNVNGTLFFAADDGTNGIELWKSDGTAAGTVMVKDINAGSASAFPNYLTELNGKLYFAANNGTVGIEFWTSDGTSAGTVKVKDLNNGPVNNVKEIVKIRNILYFSADNGSLTGLWKSTGTSAGTVRLTGHISPTKLTPSNGNLFFVADDGVNGQELWYKNTGGTVSVAEISKNRLELFPNPSTGKFTITVQNPHFSSIEVYNAVGEKVLEQQTGTEIDLSGASKGIYFVKIYDGTTAITKKVVVQ